MSWLSGNVRKSVCLRAAAAGAAVAGLVIATVPVVPAQSVPADPSCPAAIPVGDVVAGMPISGLTTTSGTTPEEFGGEVLGVLHDGIAPGLDLIMVQLRGSQITYPDGSLDKGVWAGMSGSPVYTEDGRLLGAVAYGLSFGPSDVAGVTPGAEMRKLLQSQRSTARETARSARQITIPKRLAHRMVTQGHLTRQQASDGFRHLPMPFSVSGLSNRHLQKIADRFGIKRPVVVGAGTSGNAQQTAIVAGGNLVASLSYGDITYAGIGTATAVCDNEVLAFGHPLLWSGASTLSMHGAEALYIQRDTVFGSFKVANPSAPSGQITQDRLAGLRGRLGKFPLSTDVTSHVESTEGNSRDGETVITVRRYIPYLSAIHLLSNADRVLDKIGSGSARVRWTVEGTRHNGSDWDFSRVDRFASRYDISFESIFESYRQISQILHNKFEHVRISDINYRATYDPRFHALEIAKFEIYVGGHWITITSPRPAIKVKAGSEIPVRVTLAPTSGTGASQRVLLSVKLPKSATGTGVLYVQGGAFGRGPKASSFDELLANLANAPRNDELTAILQTGGKDGSTATDSQVVSEVVSGSRNVHLKII
ncbi:MAG: hypothetical protein ABJA86_05110 [Nocardioidaceae bacterium]